jgi:hypothetical protein
MTDSHFGPSRDRARAFWQAAQTRLETVVCYCSIYDEYWSADTRVEDPVPVRACRDAGTGTFTR